MKHAKARGNAMDTDIRITNMFIPTNDLCMFYFYFQKKKDGDDTLIVHADRGWWNYQAEIIFHHVLFSNCPAYLDWNILCRLATKEEERHLHGLHDFPPSYHVYCFEDTSHYFINGPVPRDASGDIDPEFVKNALNSFSLIQQQKSFVIAQSVKVTAFFSDHHFGDTFDLWQKGDLADLSEDFQKVFLRAIESSISYAKHVEDKKRANVPKKLPWPKLFSYFSKSVEDKKRANHPHPDIDKQV